MKKISIAVLILILSLAFTGCTNNELGFYNAYKRTQDIDSMESNTVLNFTLEAEGFAKEQQQVIDQTTSMLKDSDINIYQKMIQNEDRTAATAFADMNLNIGDMSMPLSVWVDTDMSSEKPELIEIIKMPPMLMAQMAQVIPEASAKEYIVYDFEELMSESEEQIDFNELMKFGKEMQPKITDLLKSYQENFDPEVEVIKYKGTRTVNGKSLSIYELKLDDKSFKEFLRYAVNYSLNDKDTIDFIKEYMNAVTSMMKVPEEKQLVKDEVDNESNNLDKKLPEFKKKFNEFMDSTKDVQIIGDEGIVIEYGINSDGYIVHEAGIIDMIIDLETITKIIGNNVSEEAEQIKGVLKLGINYNTKIKNINEDIKIDMPEVDENNSINYYKMLNKQMKESVTTSTIGGTDRVTDVHIQQRH
ncbi:hypothetical protein K8M07_05775 [Schnuerera sp. xch1]|uniref:hypothetical protein n=1 Tax=Schnuerera sp. xch1 TaxID=2874283 RepID=UPI001CBAFE75|nr:hypothetical protein [Schnuerera sp. xch1]MBZ2174754.1 hypothetical protein [Schnuerera sp. xch1]